MTRLCATLAIAGAAAAGVACSESRRPAVPSTTLPPPTTIPPTTAPPTTGTEQWRVGGRVVATGSGRQVGGARVTSEVGATTTTAADGTFRLGSDTNPPLTPQKFTVDTAEYMQREVYLNWQQGLRENVTIDLIPLQAPFSVAFYRALVRNGYERPGALEPLRRWTSNPSFYVRTVDQAGRAIEPEVMALVLATIPRAVSDWSDGRLGVAALESGPETRAGPTGWIIVNITRDTSSTFCGQAKVGADPGGIALADDRCGCGSVKIGGAVVAHEVGHALGFWHVGDRSALMYPQAAGGCPEGALSSAERFHAALAYRRPPGNLDPDRDPRSAGYLSAHDGAPEVSCFRVGPSPRASETR